MAYSKPTPVSNSSDRTSPTLPPKPIAFWQPIDYPTTTPGRRNKERKHNNQCEHSPISSHRRRGQYSTSTTQSAAATEPKPQAMNNNPGFVGDMEVTATTMDSEFRPVQAITSFPSSQGPGVSIPPLTTQDQSYLRLAPVAMSPIDDWNLRVASLRMHHEAPPIFHQSSHHHFYNPYFQEQQSSPFQQHWYEYQPQPRHYSSHHQYQHFALPSVAEVPSSSIPWASPFTPATVGASPSPLANPIPSPPSSTTLGSSFLRSPPPAPHISTDLTTPTSDLVSVTFSSGAAQSTLYSQSLHQSTPGLTAELTEIRTRIGDIHRCLTQGLEFPSSPSSSFVSAQSGSTTLPPPITSTSEQKGGFVSFVLQQPKALTQTRRIHLRDELTRLKKMSKELEEEGMTSLRGSVGKPQHYTEYIVNDPPTTAGSFQSSSSVSGPSTEQRLDNLSARQNTRTIQSPTQQPSPTVQTDTNRELPLAVPSQASSPDSNASTSSDARRFIEEAKVTVAEMRQKIEDPQGPLLTTTNPRRNVTSLERRKIFDLVNELAPKVERTSKILPLFLAMSGKEEVTSKLLEMITLFQIQHECFSPLPQDRGADFTSILDGLVIILTAQQLEKLKTNLKNCLNFIGKKHSPRPEDNSLSTPLQVQGTESRVMPRNERLDVDRGLNKAPSPRRNNSSLTSKSATLPTLKSTPIHPTSYQNQHQPLPLVGPEPAAVSTVPYSRVTDSAQIHAPPFKSEATPLSGSCVYSNLPAPDTAYPATLISSESTYHSSRLASRLESGAPPRHDREWEQDGAWDERAHENKRPNKRRRLGNA